MSYRFPRDIMTCLLWLAAFLLSTSLAVGQIPNDIDLTYESTADGGLVVTVYEGSVAAASYEVVVEDRTAGEIRRLPVAPQVPIDVGPLDPSHQILVNVEGLAADDTVVEVSAVEEVSFGSPEVAGTMASEDILGLRIESLAPEACPHIYANARISGLPADVVLSEGDISVYEDGRLQEDLFEVIPPRVGGGVRLADIVFIVDNSGSMSNEQAAVRSNLAAFATQLEANGVDFRLGLVRFGQSGSGNPILVNAGAMASTAADFIDHYLNQLTASGGTEPGLAAILSACRNYPFRTGSQRHFLLITDEDSDGGSLSDAISCCNGNQITVHVAALCSSGHSSTDYCGSNAIRGATGGLQFNVAGPYDQILHPIMIRISGTYIVKYRTDNPCANGGTRLVRIVARYAGDEAEDQTSYTPGAAPHIQRTSETIALSDQPQYDDSPLTFAAVVTDASPPYVQTVQLHYRATGAALYQDMTMIPGAGDRYTCTVPAGAIGAPGLDYYLTATDGQVTVSDPPVDANRRPYQIAVRPNVAPVISHTPLASAQEGQAIVVRAVVTDDTDRVESVQLRYRRVGLLLFQELPMIDLGSHEYEATIPAEAVAVPGLEYEIRAWDNLGVHSSHGVHSVAVQTGPQCLTYGAIRICGDTVTQVSGDLWTVAGNVSINDLIHFSGDIQVQETALEVSGSGRITLPNVPMPGGATDLLLYEGEFTFSILGEDGALTGFIEDNLNTSLAVAGLRVRLDTIELIPDRNGVRIVGELFLPPLMGSAQLDVENLEITQADGMQIAGCLTNIPDFRLPGGIGVRDLEFCYDSFAGCIGGEGAVDVGIVSVSGEGEVCRGDLERIGIEVEVSPGVPIGATGFNLAGGSGSVANLTTPPATISITIDITGGPTVAGVSLVRFDDMGLTIRYPEFVEGGGNVLVFNQQLASGYMRYDSGDAFSVRGDINLLDVLLASLSASISSSDFRGSSHGTLRIPALHGFPFNLISKLVGLPHDIADATQEVTRNTIEGQVTINAIWPFKPVSVAHRIVFSPDLRVYFGTNFDDLRELPILLASTDANLALLEGARYFGIAQDTPLVIFTATSPSGPPAIAAVAPDGERFEATSQAAIDAGRMLYLTDPTGGITYLLIDHPLEGTWMVENLSTDPAAVIEAHRERPAPAVDVTVEDLGGSLRIISEVSSETPGALSLFYDHDRTGWDGTPIVQDMDVESGTHVFTWTPQDVPSGEYYIYARFKDPFVPAVHAYSENAFEIVDPAAPAAPTGLTLDIGSEPAALSWDPVPGVEGYAIRYGRSGDLVLDGVISLLESTSHELSELVPGYTYQLAVRSYRDGLWSTSSEVIEARLIADQANNAPEITSEPPAYVRYGERVTYAVQVVDVDGDPLSFTLQDPLPGMSLGAGGVLEWAPTEGQRLLPRARIIVDDGKGGSDEQLVTTEAVQSSYGEASISLDRRIYAGIGQRALVELRDQDVEAMDGRVRVQALCPETGDEIFLDCRETTAGSGRYGGALGFELDGDAPDLLRIREGARIIIRYLDDTTGRTLQQEAIWVAQMPLRGSLQVDPETLNQGSRGQWITVYYEPPEPYTPDQLDVGRILLEGVLRPVPDHFDVVDSDNDGSAELSMKFDREAFQSIVQSGEEVDLSLAGVLYTELATLPIQVGDAIRVIHPTITNPQPQMVLFVDVPHEITWDIPEGSNLDLLRLSASYDAMASWQTLSDLPGDATSFLWDAPAAPAQGLYLMLDAYSNGVLVGTTTTGPLSIEISTDVASGPPTAVTLRAASPNPFNPRTTIRYYLPRPAMVDLRIYDLRGKLIRRLATGARAAGEHAVEWNAQDAAGQQVHSGVYLAVLEAEGRRLSQKLILLK